MSETSETEPKKSAKVSKLLAAEDPAEFDINPLMADEEGCVAVDMRILK